MLDCVIIAKTCMKLSCFGHVVKLCVMVVEGDTDSLQLKKSSSSFAVKSDSASTGSAAAAATRG